MKHLIFSSLPRLVLYRSTLHVCVTRTGSRSSLTCALSNLLKSNTGVHKLNLLFVVSTMSNLALLKLSLICFVHCSAGFWPLTYMRGYDVCVVFLLTKRRVLQPTHLLGRRILSFSTLRSTDNSFVNGWVQSKGSKVMVID